jgi:hypothetical protein
VRAADANGDLYNGPRSSGSGSALTLRTAEQLGEPVIHMHAQMSDAMERPANFLQQNLCYLPQSTSHSTPQKVPFGRVSLQTRKQSTMRQDWFDTLFDQPYLICDKRDRGKKIKVICVVTGVKVRKHFITGPIRIRPLDKAKDKFP